MIVGVLLATLFIFLLYSLVLLEEKVYSKTISLIFGTTLFFILLFYITFNNDWEVYKAIFDGYLQSNDILFNIISDFFSSHGFEYEAVYQLHIIVMLFSFVYFVSRFSASYIFPVILIYLLFQIIPLSNQIRYFVAFSFFLIASYMITVSKNRLAFCFFFILSLLSHFGILLMFPFLLISKQDESVYLKKCLYYSLALAFLFNIIYRVGIILTGQFSSYLENDMLSSISGGLFNLGYLIVWIIFIYRRNQTLKNRFDLSDDVRYNFLYKLSLYTIIFMPSSVVLQIISHRYVAASIVVWATYQLYSLKYEKDFKMKFIQLSSLLVLYLFSLVYLYILPDYLIGYSNIKLVQELLNTNTLLQ